MCERRTECFTIRHVGQALLITSCTRTRRALQLAELEASQSGILEIWILLRKESTPGQTLRRVSSIEPDHNVAHCNKQATTVDAL